MERRLGADAGVTGGLAEEEGGAEGLGGLGRGDAVDLEDPPLEERLGLEAAVADPTGALEGLADRFEAAIVLARELERAASARRSSIAAIASARAGAASSSTSPGSGAASPQRAAAGSSAVAATERSTTPASARVRAPTQAANA
ncbi:MAG: hypothetical protein R3B09_30135 [Nannocystaceae bacterium]